MWYFLDDVRYGEFQYSSFLMVSTTLEWRVLQKECGEASEWMTV